MNKFIKVFLPAFLSVNAYISAQAAAESTPAAATTPAPAAATTPAPAAATTPAVPAPATAKPALNSEDMNLARTFVEQIGTELITTLSNTSNIEQARGLLKKYVNLASIAKFVAGKEVYSQMNPEKAATPAEKAKKQELLNKYLIAFENRLLRLYKKIFEKYKISKIDVKNVRKEQVGSKEIIFVESEVTTQSGLPYKVEWNLEKTAANFNILDVKVNDLSLRINQRTEFSTILKDSKSIEDFIAKLNN